MWIHLKISGFFSVLWTLSRFSGFACGNQMRSLERSTDSRGNRNADLSAIRMCKLQGNLHQGEYWRGTERERYVNINRRSKRMQVTSQFWRLDYLRGSSAQYTDITLKGRHNNMDRNCVSIEKTLFTKELHNPCQGRKDGLQHWSFRIKTLVNWTFHPGIYAETFFNTLSTLTDEREYCASDIWSID